jgi:glycosyltransferase involved in cell wall biosynthesis
VFFTIQSLRIHHEMKNKEIVVVDNFGDDELAKFIKEKGGNTVRYERFTDVRGVSAAKNRAIEIARGEFVLCMDSHILVRQGCFEYDPIGDDLVQGICIANDFSRYAITWLPEWRANMWGTWDWIPATEAMPITQNEIWGMGAGFFACRRDAWLGFNPAFRGFGGETGYIQEKYRKAGRRVWCYPNMQWVHYFCNTGRKIPFPVHMAERVRNYLIGFEEIGLDTMQIENHFGKEMIAKARALMIKDTATKKPDENATIQGPSETAILKPMEVR